jgi:hypothetical protein
MLTKDEILEEIRRTATLNGGAPLGKQKFFAATGIKDSDWLARYWTKWSDAIKDAGYQPNQMNLAYAEEHLLEQYGSLVRQLGRIPTSPEVKMQARNDENFPSHNTFSRFGNKSALLSKLFDFCRSNDNYSDLLPILAPVAGSLDAQESEDSASNAPTENGYVYLMLFGAEYKIGSSNSVERRFREIKTQMPYEGKIIHSIATGDPDGIEAYWHNFFKDKRLNGEWFKLSLSDVRYFKKRKLM